MNLNDIFRVFTSYRDTQLPYGRLYQKVFVVFTAINDVDNINRAIPIANQIRTTGVQIIVVALNSNGNDTTLDQLGDQFFNSSTFSVDYSLSSRISQSSCRNAGSTYSSHPIIPTTPSTNPNDLGNAIGSPCALNTTNAWLDIVFVIDVSNSVTQENLQQLGGELATIFEAFTIGQTPRHSSRVGIITYATDSQFIYNLTNVTSGDDLTTEFLRLSNYQSGNAGGNLQEGLRNAQSLLSDQGSYRRRVVVMAAASYDPEGFNDASQIAEGLKENGVTIFSISFKPSDGGFTDQLRNLSSPGYSYQHDDPNIMDKVPLGLAQVNCFCLSKTVQFKVFNQDSNNYTVYADCLSGFSGKTDPAIAEFGCSPGILAAVTSQHKLDFITDNIVPHDLSGAKNFTVGATRQNGIWYWYNYNNTKYQFGQFPQSRQDNGDYGYFSNYFGLNVGFFTGGRGIQNAKPYVCQSKACDTDYFCDLANL